jgi:hypothetical protein
MVLLGLPLQACDAFSLNIHDKFLISFFRVEPPQLNYQSEKGLLFYEFIYKFSVDMNTSRI